MSPRCPVPACPVRYRDGDDRHCADHRFMAGEPASADEMRQRILAQLAAAEEEQ